MTSLSKSDDLERRLTVMLRERATAVEVHSDPDAVSTYTFESGGRNSGRRWMLMAAAAIVVLATGLLVVTVDQDPDSVQTDTVPPTAAGSTNPTTTSPLLPIRTSPATLPVTTTSASMPISSGDEITPFAAAIEASGVLTSPSADEIARAMDGDLYKADTGPTEVSATGNYVSVRTCRFALWAIDHFERSPACPEGFPAGWAYETGTADGVEVHHGLLGEGKLLEVSVLDDRYFVVVERVPDAQAPPTAWLIDAVSGAAGPLNWRDTPTTLRSPEQALWLCEESWSRELRSSCFLPRVVDARDGTIQPLAVPDDAAHGLPVAQHGTGRIWVGTEPDGAFLGLAYSDDGGETWTAVAFPEQIAATSAELASNGRYKLLEIAADGDRVAVTLSWGDRETPGEALYLSDDSGRSWTTPSPSEPAGNHAQLFVLADGRLVMLWLLDNNPSQVLVSSGSDWAELEKVDGHFPDPTVLLGWNGFSVNQAGVAISTTRITCSFCPGDVAEVDLEIGATIDFSTDLTNWSTIDGLDDD